MRFGENAEVHEVDARAAWRELAGRGRDRQEGDRLQPDAGRAAPRAECARRARFDPMPRNLDAATLAIKLDRVGIMTGRGVEQAVGGVTVIDDSFNGNPASVAAALQSLQARNVTGGRRIAVLGDMLELGDDAPSYHTRAGQASRRHRRRLLRRSPDAASLRRASGRQGPRLARRSRHAEAAARSRAC